LVELGTGWELEQRQLRHSCPEPFAKHRPRRAALERVEGPPLSVRLKAYVKGLREARATGSEAAPEPGAGPAESLEEPAKATTKRERRRTPMAHLPTASAPRRTRTAAPSPKVAEAEALIGEVDALPAPEHVKRVGDDDVQAALETVANDGTGKTPVEEADAA
jgi:hypothetical protein